LRSGRTLIALLVSALLLAVSFFLLVDDYEQRKLSYDRRDTVGQTRAGKRPNLTAPPSQLSVLAKGLEAHTGRLLLITWSQPRRQPGAAVLDQGDQNPLFPLSNTPDFTYIVKLLLSLEANPIQRATCNGAFPHLRPEPPSCGNPDRAKRETLFPLTRKERRLAILI